MSANLIVFFFFFQKQGQGRFEGVGGTTLYPDLRVKSRHANAQLKAGSRRAFITEMAVFILETDYSCEMGYTFDNSHQIGNTS